jgi:hypothetical protein
VRKRMGSTTSSRLCERDSIQGHVPKTVGEGYGDVPPDISFQEIERLPPYVIRSST